MQLKKPAMAGTTQSSDVLITLSPHPGKGIQIDIESDVKVMFGEAIEQTVRAVLSEFLISEASVSIVDKGALDFVIRARMQCAVCRATETAYDWGKVESYGKA